MTYRLTITGKNESVFFDASQCRLFLIKNNARSAYFENYQCEMEIPIYFNYSDDVIHYWTSVFSFDFYYQYCLAFRYLS